MKVTEKKLEDGRLLLEALASTAEVNQAFTMAQYGFAQQMGLAPAPGKSVAQLAEEQLGIKDLDSIVLQQAMEYLVPFAIDKRNIIPAYPPQPQATSPLKRGQTFSFELRVEPKPEYELTSYDTVSVTVPPFTMGDVDAQVDTQIKQLAENFARYETVEPHPVGKDDTFILALEASQDGKKLDNLSTDGRSYTMGMGFMPPEFEEHLMGLAVGKPASFTFEMPGAEEGKTEAIDCTVEVKEIQKKVVPEIDDEWVAKNTPMYKDVAALRAAIVEHLSADAKGQYESFKLQAVAGELAKRFKGRIADATYEATQKSLVNNLRGQLAQQGIPFEQFVQQQGGEQQFGMLMMLQTRQTLAQGYALDALFRHEKMTIDEADLNEAGKAMNPQNPAAARREMEQSGRGFALRELAQRVKANQWLLEHAEIIEQDPNEQANAANAGNDAKKSEAAKDADASQTTAEKE